MKRLIGRFVLFLGRWKSTYPKEFRVDKCVMLAVPHTSNWDLLYALAVYWKYGVNAKFLIKNEYTKGIIGVLFRGLGAIGIDRKKNNNMVEYAMELFAKNEKFVLLVPAEGTRNKVKRWKTGFYHIAKKANVPVSLGFLDFKEKLTGIGGLVYLTDSFEDDMQIIEDFYKDMDGKFPELYNPKIF